MLCQYCNIRHASVHYNVINNGISAERHLCMECAVKLGYESVANSWNEDFVGAFLSGILRDSGAETGTSTCPLCKTARSEIMRSGKVGCAKCYEAFEELLSQYIQRIHGNTSHRGKIPGALDGEIKLKREIYSAKEQLKSAVEAQEYERAAVLRDRITALEKEVRRNGRL